MRDVKACNTQVCPGHEKQDCRWSSWGAWSGCSMECGGGQSERKRFITSEPKHGGGACAFGRSVEDKACNTQPCGRQFCTWDDWSMWTDCTRTCGTGSTQRSRLLKKVSMTASQLMSKVDAELGITASAGFGWARLLQVALASAAAGSVMTLALVFVVAHVRKALQARRTAESTEGGWQAIPGDDDDGDIQAPPSSRCCGARTPR